MEKKKRRWGDRKAGVLLRDLDGMHFITPLIYPNRCDNEAYIRETIDLTNMNTYLKKKNETETEFPYTMFHLIVAALVKTITLRPKMNRFIANKNFYQRNEVSMSFVVKKQFADEAAEALAVIHAKDDSDVDSTRIFAIRSWTARTYIRSTRRQTAWTFSTTCRAGSASSWSGS